MEITIGTKFDIITITNTNHIKHTVIKVPPAGYMGLCF